MLKLNGMAIPSRLLYIKAISILSSCFLRRVLISMPAAEYTAILSMLLLNKAI